MRIHCTDRNELQKAITERELEYRNAIKNRKVFWEVKKILEQKRQLEKQLANATMAQNSLM